MRSPRIKNEAGGYYHVYSRVVDRRMIMNPAEKERFRRLMRAVEGFSGCRVLTYAVLGNHWHALLYVPDREPVDDRELIRRLGYLYDRQTVSNLAGHLGLLRDAGAAEAAEELRAKYLCRMYDLSEFVKTLKQRYTQGYNRRCGRKGTLWEDRFHSILIEGRRDALIKVAAYIDLNAVRAGIAGDPREYRFCGYGEAMGGSRLAREGIGMLMAGAGDWNLAAAEYRKLLYLQGEARGMDEHGRPVRRGFDPRAVASVLESGGRLPLPVLLRCRVRYFTDGAVLGSRSFVDEAFRRHRHCFGARRTTGARPMRGADWGDLCSLRRLRLAVISVPGIA
jgi:REP element-mobilizing transposase RayT